MNLDENQLRDLIVAASSEAVSKAVALASVTILPGTVVNAPPGSTLVQVLIDGDTEPVQVQNPTSTVLPPTTRVLVLFFPPHGAVVLGAGASAGQGGFSPAPPGVRQWTTGPPITGDFGWFYGTFGCCTDCGPTDPCVNYLGLWTATTDLRGRVVLFPQDSPTGCVQSLVRLDAPYDRWFTMWNLTFSGNGNGGFPEAGRAGEGVALLGGSTCIGAGGIRYFGDLDAGEQAHDYANPSYAYQIGPYQPNFAHPINHDAGGTPNGLGTTWGSLLAGFDEINLGYFASATDELTGRLWTIFPSSFIIDPDTGVNNGDCLVGYLNPEGPDFIRVANLPNIAGDLREGFTATHPPGGPLYMACPSTGSGPTNEFWGYDAGIGAVESLQEIQDVTNANPPGPPVYRIGPPSLYYPNYLDDPNNLWQVDSGDTIAQVQAHYDAMLGVGVVTISGTDGSAYTVTWNRPGAQPKITGLDVSLNSGGFTVTVTQHGAGYPQTDTWTRLTDVPGVVRFRPSMGYDARGRVYVIGGSDASIGYPLTYRWDPNAGAGAWTQLDDIPHGCTPTSLYNTTGESQRPILVDNVLYLAVYSPDQTQTFVAALDTLTDAWTMSPATSLNHQRGGFTYTPPDAESGFPGALWVIGGADPISTDYNAVSEWIPAL